MGRTDSHPCQSSPANPQDNWIEEFLSSDALSSNQACGNLDFVGVVMSRLEVPVRLHPPDRTVSVTIKSQWLLLGFEVLVLVALYINAPKASLALLRYAQGQLHVTDLLQPELLGFGAGLVMVAIGAIEWISHNEENIPQTIIR
jgi:hypothetical protein